MDIDKYRPIPFFFITTDDPEELTYEKALDSLKKLKEDGFGGFILFNKPSTGFSSEKYLGREWFDMVKNFVLAAKELSLRCWINDGFNYPPGSVAGKLKELDGSLGQMRVRLVDGKPRTETVEWGYPAFELEKSSELFIKLVYEAYEREVGEYFGNVIEGFFSDADCRRVNSGIWGENSPERDFFPWSKDFSERFRLRYGYDVWEHLPKILTRTPCPEGRDYWELTSELYQSWFGSNYEWLSSRGLKYAFHTSDSPPYTAASCPRSSVFTEGRAIDLESKCDFPGTDQETVDTNASNIFFREKFYEPEVSFGDGDSAVKNPRRFDLYGDLRTKQAASAAYLYDKEGVLCEMFAASNWGATYGDLRAIALWQIMQGVSFIVPHAYHYRLTGKTKYFAPPAFGRHSHLDTEIRSFNDTLAAYAEICNRGTPVISVALLDITDALWCGEDISRNFMDAARALDLSPYGYVIADMKALRRKAKEIRVAIDPGVKLGDADRAFLEENGITLLNAREMHRLGEILPTDVSFSGVGSPHFLLRRTEEGDILILGNVEDPKGVSGKLGFMGRDFDVSLSVGEIAVFPRDARSEDVKIIEENAVLSISTAEISYLSKNVFPIERWLNGDGVAVTKSCSADRLFFNFNLRAQTEGVRLCLPKTHARAISELLLDNVPLSNPKEHWVFDDEYLFFELPTLSVGRHTLTLVKEGVLVGEDRIFLEGDFDVETVTAERFYKKSGWHYNMYRYIPRLCDVFFDAPRKQISLDASWADQGRPFYSGEAVYRVEFQIEKDTDAIIDLPEVGFTCKAYIDGVHIGTKLWAPYRFEHKLAKGSHEMQIKVVNTLANTLEFYKAPSGIMKKIAIYKR